MKSLRRFTKRLTASVLGRRDDDRVQEELAEHLALLTESLVSAGLPLDEARRRARLTLGAASAATEAYRDEQRLRWLEDLGRDFRAALRSLRRYPLAASVAVASLAAGIGATTITLTVRDVVFRKYPALYVEPQQLSWIHVRRGASLPGRVPVDLYNAWAPGRGSEMAASLSKGTREIRTGDRTETIAVRAVTPNTFDLLGVAPVLGRGFAGTSNDASQVVLSHRAWQQLFDGRGDAPGQVLWIDNQPHTVAGVMPEPFWLADMSSPVWTSLDTRTLPSDETLDTIVRRPAEVSAAVLDAQLRVGLEDYAQRQPEGQRQFGLRVSGVEGTPLGRQLSIVLPYLLATAVLLTLLIACANVAVLMFAQWTARDREIAIRASIGASRRRIVRSLLAESMLIAATGGLLGIGATLALRALVVRHGAGLALYDLSIDPMVFLHVLLVTIAAGVVTGIMPALYETRSLHANPLGALRGSDHVRQRLRHGLVVFEIAVTVALLVVAASMVDGYRRARQADMGFDARPLATARVESRAGVPADEVLRVVSGLPGVAAVATSTAVPFGMSGARIDVSTAASGAAAVAVERAAVRGPFFAALGVPIMSGRALDDREAPEARTVVVNEGLARRLFPAGNALGATLWVASQPYDVVGIARDYTSNPFLQAGDQPRIFLPLSADRTEARLQVIVRVAGDPAPLVQLLRREINRSVPDTAVSGATTFEQVMHAMGQEMLVATGPLFPLISIGTLLTMAGIYGVLAFAVSRRARELAVRAAIGAKPRALAWAVARHTVRLVMVGAGIGIALTYALSRIVRANGGAGGIYDPSLEAFTLPVFAIALVAFVATWLPARRAASIDPARLLRSE